MNGPRRTIAALDTPTPVLVTELRARRLRQDPLESLRASLPLDDPDRHALDLVDSWFAADAAAHPGHGAQGGDGR
ncbi:hypothetical protein [Streptomyces phytophilus]|uniref:hypothetical protein n=1 Tax=Streptomyces phytophilus TaxID=722715 RepID=UPI0015F03DB8|nr:hypothetical protein [Streptomyces phytophilus]